MTEPHPTRLDWVEDELILACDLVARNDWRVLEDNDPTMVELSKFLRALPLHPFDERLPNFRNPNDVATSCLPLLHAEIVEHKGIRSEFVFGLPDSG